MKTHFIFPARLAILSLTAMFIAGCSTVGVRTHQSADSAPVDWIIPPEFNDATIVSEALEEHLEEQATPKAKRVVSSSTVPVTTFHSAQSIPMEMNEHVQRWITYFTGPAKERFGRMLSRGAEMEPWMRELLKESGVPEEMIYIALIESGFRNHAVSRASAVGVWQFIRGTATRYNMRVDHWVDERRDPYKATVAAAQYMQNLYNVFGSWYLAFSAYNAGENRVQRAIMTHNTRDFWELVEKRALPQETRNYVPKYIAARIIAQDPAKWGIEVQKPGPQSDWVRVEVPSPLPLDFLASQTGTTVAEFKRHNPAILTNSLPGNQRVYQVWLPPNGARVAENNRVAWQTRSQNFRQSGISPGGNYRVQRGDSWYRVARRFGTSVAELKRANNTNRNRLYVGETIQLPGGVQSATVASSGTVRAPAASGSGGEFYVVQPGDTLSKISAQTNMTIRAIRNWNNLNGNNIRVGQRLRVAPAGSAPSRPQTYRVQRGDSLIRIARRFGVPVRHIMQLNNIQSKDEVLMAGRNLRL